MITTFLYSSSQKSMTMIKASVITTATRKSSESFCSTYGCCEAVSRTACRYLDYNIPINSIPNINLVNKISKVKSFAQVHNMLAVEGLKLTTCGL